METTFKNWLCPNFLVLPKTSELPKIWGGCSPLRPPRPPPPRPVGLCVKLCDSPGTDSAKFLLLRNI